MDTDILTIMVIVLICLFSSALCFGLISLTARLLCLRSFHVNRSSSQGTHLTSRLSSSNHPNVMITTTTTTTTSSSYPPTFPTSTLVFNPQSQMLLVNPLEISPPHTRQATHIDKPMVCAVCLEPLCDMLAAGDCHHWMHAQCLKTWLRKDTSRSCPVCRAAVRAVVPTAMSTTTISSMDGGEGHDGRVQSGDNEGIHNGETERERDFIYGSDNGNGTGVVHGSPQQVLVDAGRPQTSSPREVVAEGVSEIAGG